MADDPQLRPSNRKLPVFPPSDLRGRWSREDQGYLGGSVVVARLLAWIDAVAANATWDEVLAAMDSVEQREQARLEGWNTEAARWLAEQASPELREAFESEVPMERVLGWWDVDEGWHPGLAQLTYLECQATTLSLNGDQPWEVARSEKMLSRRRRRMGETVPVEDVYKYLSTSAAKLRALFGQPEEAGATIEPSPESKPVDYRPPSVGIFREGEVVEGPEYAEDEENPDPEVFEDDVQRDPG